MAGSRAARPWTFHRGVRPTARRVRASPGDRAFPSAENDERLSAASGTMKTLPWGGAMGHSPCPAVLEDLLKACNVLTEKHTEKHSTSAGNCGQRLSFKPTQGGVQASVKMRVLKYQALREKHISPFQDPHCLAPPSITLERRLSQRLPLGYVLHLILKRTLQQMVEM